MPDEQAATVTRLFSRVLFRPGAEAAVRALIDAGHDIEATDNVDRWTVLHHVLVPVHVAPNVVLVELLLRNGADPNRRDRRGWTPLHFAARSGEREVITCLLAAGADPNVADEEGITPLHRYLLRPSPRALARAARDVEIVRGMVAHGAEATPLIASFLGAVSFENDTEIRAAMALTAAR